MNALILSLVLSCPGVADCPAHKAEAKAAPQKDAASCNHPTSAQAAAPAKTQADVLLRGEKLKGLPAVELTSLLASAPDFDGKAVAVKGLVRKSCEKKGCWMELAAGKDGPGVRVTFKDYGFFVPLDSAGSTATVEGQVKVALLSDAKAKHLIAEGAQVPKAKDGTFREVQLVAVGVELRR